jgi:glutaredoxin 2
MLDFIAQIFYEYRNMVHQQPPVNMIGYFSNLAHLFYTALHYPGGREKEELLKYFYEWKDVTPGNFEELLGKTIDIVYDHHNIQQSLEQVNSFLQVLAALWSKLSSLEFIGQRRENIVVAEQQVIQQTQARKTWTLLD